MVQPELQSVSLTVHQVDLEVEIEAHRERVWTALIHEIDLWWRKDFFAAQGTKRFVLEPKLGGKMYEDAGDGTGLTWYTVMGIEPMQKLLLVGYLTPEFGGPSTSMVQIILKNSERRTIVQISESIMGKSKDCSNHEAGWKLLFEDGLKAHVEKG